MNTAGTLNGRGRVISRQFSAAASVTLAMRMASFARSAQPALAPRVMLIAITDARAEHPHPLLPRLFDSALALPLAWRRRRPSWLSAELAIGLFAAGA
jgi:hypothetical protein